MLIDFNKSNVNQTCVSASWLPLAAGTRHDIAQFEPFSQLSSDRRVAIQTD